MDLLERSYAGEFFRPKPKIILADNPLRLMIVTSWGERDESEHIFGLFQDQTLFDLSVELTTPVGRIESLGPIANRLRNAAVIANEYLYRDSNRTEYICAAEFLAVVYQEGVLSWVQVGSPHLLLSAQGHLHPLAYQFDFAGQYKQSAPLMSQALGLEASCQFSCGSLHLSSGSELFFLSRSSIPPTLFSETSISLKEATNLLVQDSPQIPFWIGHLTLR